MNANEMGSSSTEEEEDMFTLTTTATAITTTATGTTTTTSLPQDKENLLLKLPSNIKLLHRSKRRSPSRRITHAGEIMYDGILDEVYQEEVLENPNAYFQQLSTKKRSLEDQIECGSDFSSSLGNEETRLRTIRLEKRPRSSHSSREFIATSSNNKGTAEPSSAHLKNVSKGASMMTKLQSGLKHRILDPLLANRNCLNEDWLITSSNVQLQEENNGVMTVVFFDTETAENKQ